MSGTAARGLYLSVSIGVPVGLAGAAPSAGPPAPLLSHVPDNLAVYVGGVRADYRTDPTDFPNVFEFV